jgi:hypothetical protein
MRYDPLVRFLRMLVAMVPVGASLGGCLRNPVVSVEGDASETGSTTITTTTTTPGTEAGGDTSSASTSHGATGGNGTSTENGGTSTGSESDTETGGAFIAEPDHGSHPVECDVWVQDCAQGEKCAPWYEPGMSDTDVTRCVPIVPSPKGIYEDCQVEPGYYFGPDDCGLALLCVGVHPDTGHGYCVGLCRLGETPQDPDCEDPSAWCDLGSGSWSVCLPACKPLSDACHWDEVCAPHGCPYGFACSPASPSPDGNGEPCDASQQSCVAGHYCAAGDRVPGCTDYACCTEYCSLSDPACTLPGVECVSFYEPEPAPEGLEDVGICVLP